ncbi:MAG: hypothetical protein H6837_18835 [Planctomycetes bacterium]|nr:hypothetical protein [Planctomycetota bacterium]
MQHKTQVVQQATVTALLQHVAQLLEQDNPEQALQLLDRAAAGDSYLDNARGVCLMRMGRIKDAVFVFRRLAMRGEYAVDLRASPELITNFATALLLDHNLGGCRGLLFELEQERGVRNHPAANRLNACIERYRAKLGFWQRLWFSAREDYVHEVAIDFPPGDLTMPPQSPEPAVVHQQG